MDREASADLRARIAAEEARAAPIAARLATLLQEMIRESRAVVEGLQVSQLDHLGFLAVHFHGKQLCHAESLIVLEDRGDGALVARSMLEGLCLLKWAAQEPERPIRWRHYSAILDWRSVREMDARGHPVGEKDRAATEERLALVAHEFLSAKAQSLQAQGKPLPPDPYVDRWYRPQLRQIFEAVKADELYDGPYHHMSEWHHWSPGGLAQAMWNADDRIGFRSRLPGLQLLCLANAYQCLAETSLFVLKHFDHEGGERILDAIKRYTAEPVMATP